jgi:hypothetical protein
MLCWKNSTGEKRMKTILVIDGQGGRIGRLLIEGIKAGVPNAEVLAVGTNSIATAAMLKAGAERGATGENAVIVNCRRADVIAGPLGIVVADSLMGEISRAMAAAVGQSAAVKVLIPINLCNNIVVGAKDRPIRELLALAVAEIAALCS